MSHSEQEHKHRTLLGALLTLSGGACWGLSGTMGQYLFTVQGMDSRWLVTLRLGIAGIILLIWNQIRRPGSVMSPWKNKRTALDLVIYGLLGVSMCQFLYFLTIQLSSAAMGTIMQDLSPIMIMAVSCTIAKRRPFANEILSILCALAGVFLLTTHGDPTHLSMSPAAVISGVFSAVGVTIYNMIAGRLTDKFPVSLLQGWSFLMGGIGCGLAFQPWKFGYVPNRMGLFGIAFVVLVGNVLAFTTYITGVKYIGPEKGILYGFAEPVTAAILATAFLGSTFTIYDALGFVLIFLMMVFISQGETDPEEKKTGLLDRLRHRIV